MKNDDRSAGSSTARLYATRSPQLSTSRLSLVYRGFAVAIAHIRGATTLLPWSRRQEGAHQHFTIRRRHSCPDRSRYANPGRSRRRAIGGAIDGAVVNRPRMIGAVVAVCVVDVPHGATNSPLTGRGTEQPYQGKAAFELCAATAVDTSPQCLSAMLDHRGLNDRASYWEPANCRRKLRATKPTTMPAAHVNWRGHGGNRAVGTRL